MKKLRYTADFFESLFTGSANSKVLSHYKDCLESLQDSLGALNDIAAHQKLVTNVGMNGEEKKSRLVSFAAGAVLGSECCEIGPLLDVTKKAARKLRRAEEFWS